MQLFLKAQVEQLAAGRWGSPEPYIVTLSPFAQELLAWLLEDLERLKALPLTRPQFRFRAACSRCSGTGPGERPHLLTDAQQKLWQTYLHAEGRAPRAEKLVALTAFLDALEASPTQDWSPWARSIAEQVVDHGLDLVIRQPLFDEAIFPALLAGFREGLPGCARWLAGLSQHVLRSAACQKQLEPQEPTELALLHAALRQDPQDRRSARRMIEVVANRLRFALHELPSGVLYGMDGATPEQCLELQDELEHFDRLIAEQGLTHRHAELVQDCRLHFTAYREYLLDPDRVGSYAEYLSQRRSSSATGDRPKA